jgi:ABC-2 type transport system ATP-binding protein
MKTSLLQAERLGKRFGAVEAVKDATFDVHPHTITAFLGENGAGKTTVLKLVLGFLSPDSGRFSFATERVGYVPERPAFFPWLRGDQILRCTARAFGLSGREAEREIGTMGRRIAFDPRLLARKVHTYSLGNQKKFSYLQSLLVNPDLLIVDEPFSALDPATIKSVRALFLELRAQGKALLLSSHLISELEKVCDEFIIIKGGRVVAQENLPKIRDSHIFVRFARSHQGKWASIPLPYLQKTRGCFVEWLLPRNRLREIDHSLLETAEVRPPDLETIYFFLAD